MNERENDLDDVTEEEREYEKQVAKLTIQKELIFEEDFKLKFLLMHSYKVILGDTILQQLLYHLGYTKEEVNVSKTNVLNWRSVKGLLDEKNFFSRIDKYEFRGPKGKVKPYAMINKLLVKVDAMIQAFP